MARYNLKPRSSSPNEPKYRPSNDNKPDGFRPANDNRRPDNTRSSADDLPELAEIVNALPEPVRKVPLRRLVRRFARNNVAGYIGDKLGDIALGAPRVNLQEHPVPAGAYNVKICTGGPSVRVNKGIARCGLVSYSKDEDMFTVAETNSVFTFFRPTDTPSPFANHVMWETVLSYLMLPGSVTVQHSRSLGPATRSSAVPVPRTPPRFSPAPAGTPLLDPYTGREIGPRPASRTDPRSSPAIAVGPNGKPAPAPGHAYRPPPKKAKEFKIRAIGPLYNAINKIIGGAGEGIDIIDAIHDALPDSVKTKPTSNRFGNPTARKELTPQQKLRDIYNHIDKVNIPDALKNLIENHFEDKFWGKVGSLSPRATQAIDRPIGIEVGPAL